MDWWAALMLLWVARVLQRRGGTLTLAAPEPAVAALLRSAGACEVISIYKSVKLAAGAGTAWPAAKSAKIVSVGSDHDFGRPAGRAARTRPRQPSTATFNQVR